MADIFAANPDEVRKFLEATGMRPVASDDVSANDITKTPNALRGDGITGTPLPATDPGTINPDITAARLSNPEAPLPTALETIGGIAATLDREPVVTRAPVAPVLTSLESAPETRDLQTTDALELARRQLNQIRETLDWDRQRTTSGVTLPAGNDTLPEENADPSLEGSYFDANSFRAGTKAGERRFYLDASTGETPGAQTMSSNENEDDEDNMLSFAVRMSQLDAEIQQLKQEKIELENKLAELAPENRALIDDRNQALARIHAIQERREELKQDGIRNKHDLDRVETNINNLVSSLDPELARQFAALEKTRESLIWVRIKIDGMEQNTHIVYKDARGEYIEGPNGNVYIAELPEDKQRRINSQIERAKEDPRREYGNENPDAAAEYKRQTAEFIRTTGSSEFRQLYNTLNEYKNSLLDQQREIRNEMRALDDELKALEARVASIEDKLGDTPEERALLQQILQKEEQIRIAGKKREALNDRINGFDQRVVGLTERINGKEVKNIDELMQYLSPEEQAYLRGEDMRKMFLQNHPGDQITDASRVIKDRDGNFVYRDTDNDGTKDGELYRLKRDQNNNILKDETGEPVREYYRDMPGYLNTIEWWNKRAYDPENPMYFRNEVSSNLDNTPSPRSSYRAAPVPTASERYLNDQWGNVNNTPLTNTFASAVGAQDAWAQQLQQIFQPLINALSSGMSNQA